MIRRLHLMAHLRRALRRHRVAALLGPRQCGKTTMARQLVDARSRHYFDLEDPATLALLEQPMVALRDLTGLVVIDEIQRRPDLFPVLRVLADREPLPARFLILGSAAPELLRQSSESLAGRIGHVFMGGFTLGEVGIPSQAKHWLRGGFPLSFLAGTDEASFDWRKNFILTFLERDLPQMGFNIPATTLLRFWTMVAHYHGQVWNTAEFAQSMGLSGTPIRRYLDLLADVFMVRQLQPWHANLGKRQVKSPKVYFRDTGLLHQLLGVHTEKDLLTHPKSGASWEGYVIEEVLRAVEPDESYFWATHNGAEIDLLLIKDGRKFGVECKRMDAPRMTPSMAIALRDLGLERIAVIYPGSRHYQLSDRIHAAPLESLLAGMRGIFGAKGGR